MKKVIRTAQQWRELGVPIPWFVPDESRLADARVEADGSVVWSNAWSSPPWSEDVGGSGG